ncbi:transporter [Noviherbaspirillum aerium]|uniref:transporter n=1 Tax=Noviherbaspirillum aerium TaxID=2588497 RepID=UPI00124E613D|nr:transporter [Noviherbaspirillum aerium]
MSLRVCVGVLLCMAAFVAHAELPMQIEDLITERGKFKFEGGLSYANNDRQEILTGRPLSIQIGPASFVSLPYSVTESKGNSDIVVGTLGLRYGLYARTELYSRISYLYSSHRNIEASNMSYSSDQKLADAWVGVNYKFKEDDDTPALLSFVEVALYEKHRISNAYAKSALLGLTAFKAIDPIVLSLTAAYRANFKRRDDHAAYDPGNTLLLNPSIAFAVNDRITLSAGVQWMNAQADTVEGKPQGFRRTSTDLLIGMAYGFSRGHTLSLSLKQNASGRDGADLRANWLYTF